MTPHPLTARSAIHAPPVTAAPCDLCIQRSAEKRGAKEDVAPAQCARGGAGAWRGGPLCFKPRFPGGGAGGGIMQMRGWGGAGGALSRRSAFAEGGAAEGPIRRHRQCSPPADPARPAPARSARPCPAPASAPAPCRAAEDDKHPGQVRGGGCGADRCPGDGAVARGARALWCAGAGGAGAPARRGHFPLRGAGRDPALSPAPPGPGSGSAQGPGAASSSGFAGEQQGAGPRGKRPQASRGAGLGGGLSWVSYYYGAGPADL